MNGKLILETLITWLHPSKSQEIISIKQLLYYTNFHMFFNVFNILLCYITAIFPVTV